MIFFFNKKRKKIIKKIGPIPIINGAKNRFFLCQVSKMAVFRLFEKHSKNAYFCSISC